MIKIAIVEDEEEMLNTLKEYIKRFFTSNDLQYDLTCFGTASKLINTYKFEYDLIFMDINLPGIDGMSAVKELRDKDSNVTVIFVTSLAQYAIKGYEVNAFDFVLKPISYYNFALKLNRYIEHLNITLPSFVIKNKNGVYKIDIRDLKYIEVLDHKLIFYTTKGEYETFDTLNKYVDMLKSEAFELCNRCYLVNLKYVKKVTKESVFIGEEEIQMSRRKYKDFMKALNEYIGKGGEIN